MPLKKVLISGLSVELGEFNLGHQATLSKEENLSGEGIREVLKDTILTINGARPSIEDIDKLLSADRKHALILIRNFSLDFDPKFKFTYSWENLKTNKMEKQDYELEFDEADLELRGYQSPIFDEEGELVGYEHLMFASIQDIDLKRTIEIPKMPKSGLRVKFNLMTGAEELAATRIPKRDRDINSSIMLRNPRYFELKEGSKTEGTWIQLNIDKMGLRDGTFLREVMNNCEAAVDTKFIIQHQEDEARKATLDIMSLPAFYFPSVQI